MTNEELKKKLIIVLDDVQNEAIEIFNKDESMWDKMPISDWVNLESSKRQAKIAIDFAIEQLKENLKNYKLNNAQSIFFTENKTSSYKSIDEITLIKINELQKQKEKL